MSFSHDDNPLRPFAAILAALALGGCTSIPKGRSAIDDVVIHGAHAIDPSDVADKLATGATSKFLGLFRGVVYDYEVYDPSVLQRDMARVERFYRGKGFFEAHARVGRVEQLQPGHVQVEIVVEEGPPTLNAGTKIEGIDGLPGDVVAAAHAAVDADLPNGARFDEDKYQSALDDLKKALTDRSYAYAAAERDAAVDVASHRASYVFKVVPGPSCTFGPITIVGLDPDGDGPRPQEIQEKPLLRAMNIDEGDPYSTADIDTATQALLELEVFSAAKIDPDLPQPPPAHPVIPLKVTVEPTALRTVRIGGGVELDEIKTDIHLIGGWEDHNFLGGLRDLDVQIQPGVVPYPFRIGLAASELDPLPEVRTKLQFRQPSFLEARTSAFVKAEFNAYPFLVVPNPPPTAPVVGYFETKESLGVDRPFGKSVSVSLAYNVQVEDPFHYPWLRQTGDALPPVIVLAYPQLVTKLDLRDDPTHPHEGFYFANDLQVANAIFGSRADDVRIQPEARGYAPLGKRVTFATRASVGFLFPSNYQIARYLPNSDAVKDRERAPAAPDPTRSLDLEEMYFRGFTSGGPTSNRGFPVRGIAPYGYVPFLLPATYSAALRNGCTAACTLPIAGATLWEASAEFRFEVSGPFSTALFCDMGDVSPYQTDLRFTHLHLSCGAGVRYDTPVGPIRLDIGYRIQPLQVLGYPNEAAAATANQVDGQPPLLFTGSQGGLPIAISFGIGEAY